MEFVMHTFYPVPRHAGKALVMDQATNMPMYAFRQPLPDPQTLNFNLQLGDALSTENVLKSAFSKNIEGGSGAKIL
jgi:hypothetical protein